MPYMTFEALDFYSKLDIDSKRIIQFLKYKDEFVGGYTKLTEELGIEKSCNPNVRRACIKLNKLGLLMIYKENKKLKMFLSHWFFKRLEILSEMNEEHIKEMLEQEFYLIKEEN